jgi:hypothetical protein
VKLPDEIRITRRGIFVDEVQFPYAVAVNTVNVPFRDEDLPVVELTLLAKRVIVDNDMRPSK